MKGCEIMPTNTVEIDFQRYDSKMRAKYQAIIRELFYCKIIKTTEEKVKFLEEITQQLPVRIRGDSRKVKIKTILTLMNNILDGTNQISYTTKSGYTRIRNEAVYSTHYYFHLK